MIYGTLGERLSQRSSNTQPRARPRGVELPDLQSQPLLINVPEIEIEIGNRCPPSLAQGHDILSNSGHKTIMSSSQSWKGSEEEPVIMEKRGINKLGALACASIQPMSLEAPNISQHYEKFSQSTSCLYLYGSSTTSN